jgi:signal transduction histidine kinase
VTVGWSKSRGFVRFWVENAVDGNGSRHHGMGLGLIISRTIAQAHGGRLAMETTAAGKVRSTLHMPLREGPYE